MKKFMPIVLCLLIVGAFPLYAEGDPEFGFTGVVKKYVVKHLKPQIHTKLTDEKNIADPLKVLMVGFSKLEPTDTDFECFHFVTYYYPETFYKNYVAMIVANASNKNRSGVDIIIDVKGPKSSKIQVKRVIPMNTVMLYVFEFNNRFSPDNVGIYDIIGTVSHRLIWVSQAVTRLYIDDIW